jgi:hypothetical protein
MSGHPTFQQSLCFYYFMVSLAVGHWALDPPGRDNHVQMSRADALLFRWLQIRWLKRRLVAAGRWLRRRLGAIQLTEPSAVVDK